MKNLLFLIVICGFFTQKLNAVIVNSVLGKDHEITFENGSHFIVPACLKVQKTDDFMGIMIYDENDVSSEKFIIFNQEDDQSYEQNYLIIDIENNSSFEVPFTFDLIIEDCFLIIRPNNTHSIRIKKEEDVCIATKKEKNIDDCTTELINYFDQKNKFIESLKFFFITQQIENKINYLKQLHRFSTNEITQHISETFLARVYLLGLGSIQKNPERLTIAFKLFTKAAAKNHSPWAKRMAKENLSKMYFLGLGTVQKESLRFQKAFDFLMNTPHEEFNNVQLNYFEKQFNYFAKLYLQTNNDLEKHIAETFLARMYLLGIGPAQNIPNRIQIAFDLFMDAAIKDHSSWAKHIAEANLATICINHFAPTEQIPIGFETLYDLLIKASQKTISPIAQYTTQRLLNDLNNFFISDK